MDAGRSGSFRDFDNIGRRINRVVYGRETGRGSLISMRISFSAGAVSRTFSTLSRPIKIALVPAKRRSRKQKKKRRKKEGTK